MKWLFCLLILTTCSCSGYKKWTGVLTTAKVQAQREWNGKACSSEKVRQAKEILLGENYPAKAEVALYYMRCAPSPTKQKTRSRRR